MAAKEDVNQSEEYVYRISTAEEWEALQTNGTIFGGELDKSSGFIHLSNLHQEYNWMSFFGPNIDSTHVMQVKSTLQNFFLNTKKDLYLLQIDAKKLGDGLVYEGVDASNVFPHFYGPSRSFSPLPLDSVTKAEKIFISEGQFICSLLN